VLISEVNNKVISSSVSIPSNGTVTTTTNSSIYSVHLSDIIDLAIGDTIGVYGYTSNGGGAFTNATSNTCYFSIAKL